MVGGGETGRRVRGTSGAGEGRRPPRSGVRAAFSGKALPGAQLRLAHKALTGALAAAVVMVGMWGQDWGAHTGDVAVDSLHRLSTMSALWRWRRAARKASSVALSWAPQLLSRARTGHFSWVKESMCSCG